MKMRVQMTVGWDPVRDQEGDSYKATLTTVQEFVTRPQAGEHVMLFGDWYKIAQFYHDLDAGELVVQFVGQWAHTTDEAKTVIQKLVQKGWSDGSTKA